MIQEILKELAAVLAIMIFLKEILFFLASKMKNNLNRRYKMSQTNRLMFMNL